MVRLETVWSVNKLIHPLKALLNTFGMPCSALGTGCTNRLLISHQPEEEVLIFDSSGLRSMSHDIVANKNPSV